MSTLQKIALVVIAGGSLVVGVWAQGFPQSFYDDFPGMGRVWVAVDGPFNEHLVRDVGGLNLALAFVAVMALVTRSTLLARVTGGAALLYGLPHWVYHVVLAAALLVAPAPASTTPSTPSTPASGVA
jgi:hypothetical protein